MIHNIVTDKNGDEHQAVKGDNCNDCSLEFIDCADIPANCIPNARGDGEEVIYKRRIKIGDVKR